MSYSSSLSPGSIPIPHLLPYIAPVESSKENNPPPHFSSLLHSGKQANKQGLCTHLLDVVGYRQEEVNAGLHMRFDC